MEARFCVLLWPLQTGAENEPRSFAAMEQWERSSATCPPLQLLKQGAHQREHVTSAGETAHEGLVQIG